MRYGAVSRKRQGKMTATGLNGGLNRRELPFAVADDQLTDCCNLWWQDGVLHSRPGLQIVNRSGTVGKIQYSTGADEQYIMCRLSVTMTTGKVQPDGHFKWNVGGIDLPAAGWRVRYDATRLEGWTDGAGDGTIIFLVDGQVLAPLAEGGYRQLDDLVYVPRMLVGGVGVTSDQEPPITVFEPPNLLTTAFRASYTTDGEGLRFYLPVKKVDNAYPITAVYQNAEGEEVLHRIPAGFTQEYADRADGLHMVYLPTRHCIVFKQEDGSLKALETAGVSDNLTVTAHFVDDTVPGAEVIGQMKFGCWFGGESSGLTGGTRLFVAGNPAYPHRIYWSDIDRPLYFPQDNYALVGDATQAVTAFAKQDEMLVIFKEHEMYAATYRAGSVTASDTSGARFPLVPLHGEIGCDCPATVRLCQNRLVWLTSEGRVYTLVSGNAYSQCNVRQVSGVIEPLLQKVSADVLQAASSGYYRGWYCLLAGREMMLLHCEDAAFERLSTGSEPTWYRWSFDEAVEPERVLSFPDSMVLIDTKGCTYVFGGTTDTVDVQNRKVEKDIPCMLRTKLFDFGNVDRRKTVRELLFTLGVLRNGTLTATYLTDQGERRECRTFTVTERDERRSEFMRAVRLTPHAARVRRFALELSCTGAVALGALTVRYDIENAMEKGVG